MVWGEVLCALALVGWRKGLVLCADSEAAGSALLGERFVKIAVSLFEARCVEAV